MLGTKGLIVLAAITSALVVAVIYEMKMKIGTEDEAAPRGRTPEDVPRRPSGEPERAFSPTLESAPSAWWCGDDFDGFASCFRTLAACDDLRRKEFDVGREVPDCRGQKASVCFEAEAVVSGSRTSRCYESITVCRNMSAEFLRGSAADFRVSVDCEMRE